MTKQQQDQIQQAIIEARAESKSYTRNGDATNAIRARHKASHLSSFLNLTTHDWNGSLTQWLDGFVASDTQRTKSLVSNEKYPAEGRLEAAITIKRILRGR